MTDYPSLLAVLRGEVARATSATPFQEALAVLSEHKGADPAAERREALLVREAMEARALSLAVDGRLELASDALGCVERVLLLNAPIDLDSYMLFMEWNRPPEKCFYRPRRKVFLPHVVSHMQDLADGELDFLSLSLPPRTGKSTGGIFFLSWMMGRHPERANVMSGHSDSLTAGFHVECLGLITDGGTYRFAEAFPDARFVDKSMAKETIRLEGSSERYPSLTCRSIGGTLTGAVEVGQDALLYLDDLVEDREQALSTDRMDKLYAAYLNQLKDRMKDGAKQLAVATRWVPNDPIGRIEDEYGDDPRYRFVAVPALDAAGRSNFDYPYGLGFSTAYYEDMRRSLVAAGEDDSWSAKYMADPYWKSGLMFPRDGLRFFDELPAGEPDAVLAACDTKDRGSDYAVQVVAAVYGKDHYVVDVVCDAGLPEAFEPRLAASLARNGVGVARYESNSAGGRVADDVEALCREMGHVVRMEKRFSTQNKETRILVDSGWVKERCLFRREAPGDDYRRFMSMLTGYAVSGKARHDDAPDAMSMYKRLACSLMRATVEPMERPC